MALDNAKLVNAGTKNRTFFNCAAEDAKNIWPALDCGTYTPDRAYVISTVVNMQGPDDPNFYNNLVIGEVVMKWYVTFNGHRPID